MYQLNVSRPTIEMVKQSRQTLCLEKKNGTTYNVVMLSARDKEDGTKLDKQTEFLTSYLRGLKQRE